MVLEGSVQPTSLAGSCRLLLNLVFLVEVRPADELSSVSMLHLASLRTTSVFSSSGMTSSLLPVIQMTMGSCLCSNRPLRVSTRGHFDMIGTLRQDIRSSASHRKVTFREGTNSIGSAQTRGFLQRLRKQLLPLHSQKLLAPLHCLGGDGSRW